MRPSRLRKRRADLYTPTLEKDLTRARSPSIRACGRYSLPRSVWNLTPMYTRSWVGARSDFFRFTMNLAWVSTWRVFWTDCSTLQGESLRMRMSLRYGYSCTPVSLSHAIERPESWWRLAGPRTGRRVVPKTGRTGPASWTCGTDCVMGLLWCGIRHLSSPHWPSTEVDALLLWWTSGSPPWTKSCEQWRWRTSGSRWAYDPCCLGTRK